MNLKGLDMTRPWHILRLSQNLSLGGEKKYEKAHLVICMPWTSCEQGMLK
jgi:hypothetical protein